MGKTVVDVVAGRTDNRLVERMRARLEAGYWPRVQCMLIVTISSAVAFLTSVLLIVLQVRWVSARYGLAVLAGYATFLLVLRAWMRWKWSRLQLDEEDSDLAGNVLSNVPLDLEVPNAPLRFAGGGGRSGGGGASGS